MSTDCMRLHFFVNSSIRLPQGMIALKKMPATSKYVAIHYQAKSETRKKSDNKRKCSKENVYPCIENIRIYRMQQISS